MKKILVMFIVLFSASFYFGVQSSEASLFDIWADTTDTGSKDVLLGTISGYVGTIGAKENYDYFSASGHLINGPEQRRNTMELFIYQNSLNNRDFLNIIAGKDGVGARRYLGVTVDITGSILDPRVRESDDNGELEETYDNHFEGDWSFLRNTDGGVIGPLKGSWEAMITPGDSDLANYGAYSSDGSIISLDSQGTQYYRFFIVPKAQAEATPEPATLSLLGLGALGLFLRRKKAA